MEKTHKPDALKNEATPAKPPYDTPELTRYGTVEELTLGAGGIGGTDSVSQ